MREIADDSRGSRKAVEVPQKATGDDLAHSNEICKCTHQREKHPHDKDCIQLVDVNKAKYCTCYAFREEKL